MSSHTLGLRPWLESLPKIGAQVGRSGCILDSAMSPAGTTCQRPTLCVHARRACALANQCDRCASDRPRSTTAPQARDEALAYIAIHNHAGRGKRRVLRRGSRIPAARISCAALSLASRSARSSSPKIRWPGTSTWSPDARTVLAASTHSRSSRTRGARRGCAVSASNGNQ